MTQTVHIDLGRPRKHQLYYERLAGSLAKLSAHAMRIDGCHHTPPRVLDIGCGGGELLECLVKLKYKAIGIDQELSCAIRSRQHAPVVVADLWNLGELFPPSAFDIVVASNILEHIENPKRAIQIMRSLSRRWIIIAVPNLQRLATYFVRKPRFVNAGHLQGWDSHHLKTMLEKSCQLRIVRWVVDSVTIPPLRSTPLLDTPVLRLLEDRLLPTIAPQFANSLIVLCEMQTDC